MSQGKVDKAIVILRKFEKVNKAHIEENIYKEFEVIYKLRPFYNNLFYRICFPFRRVVAREL